MDGGGSVSAEERGALEVQSADVLAAVETELRILGVVGVQVPEPVVVARGVECLVEGVDDALLMLRGDHVALRHGQETVGPVDEAGDVEGLACHGSRPPVWYVTNILGGGGPP